MIKLSKQSDYGLQLLGALADASLEHPLSLRSFSTERSISFLFLQRIASSLRKAGFIVAKQGSQGGYYLLRSLSDISVAEVVEALDGDLAIAACQKDGTSCAHESECNVKKGMTRLQQQLQSLLSTTSVADFLA